MANRTKLSLVKRSRKKPSKTRIKRKVRNTRIKRKVTGVGSSTQQLKEQTRVFSSPKANKQQSLTKEISFSYQEEKRPNLEVFPEKNREEVFSVMVNSIPETNMAEWGYGGITSRFKDLYNDNTKMIQGQLDQQSAVNDCFITDAPNSWNGTIDKVIHIIPTGSVDDVRKHHTAKITPENNYHKIIEKALEVAGNKTTIKIYAPPIGMGGHSGKTIPQMRKLSLVRGYLASIKVRDDVDLEFILYAKDGFGKDDHNKVLINKRRESRYVSEYKQAQEIGHGSASLHNMAAHVNFEDKISKKLKESNQKRNIKLYENYYTRIYQYKKPDMIDGKDILKAVNPNAPTMEIEDAHGHLGRKGYPVHKMFKILLLQAWHSQSDPGMEASLKVRLDFLRFAGFTLGENLPDDTTICKFRNKLIKQGKYDKLLKEINSQLEEMGLKIKEAKEAIVDATIVRSAARPNRKYKESHEADKYEKEESKDEDARWLKKGKKCYFGYRCFANVDKEGYINKGYAVPANAAETKEFCRITKDTTERSRVYTDKGFCSKENRINLKTSNKKNGIMYKENKNSKLSFWQKRFNKIIAKTRWVVEQTFGTMKRKFSF